jgi:hypothetical protein
MSEEGKEIKEEIIELEQNLEDKEIKFMTKKETTENNTNNM